MSDILLRPDLAARNRTHGKHGTLTYNSWRAMIDRCTHQTNRAFENYGGRGIKVCNRWRQFENFYADMGDRPSRKHTIERINNNGDYEPYNVIWETRSFQCRNKRNNRMLTHKGKTMCVVQWAEQLGLRANTLFHRLYRGWSIGRSLGV